MSDHVSDVIAALRRQAESAVDAAIPINPQDLLVLLNALDGKGTTRPAAGEVEAVETRPAQSIGDRYHGSTVRDIDASPDAAA